MLDLVPSLSSRSTGQYCLIIGLVFTLLKTRVCVQESKQAAEDAAALQQVLAFVHVCVCQPAFFELWTLYWRMQSHLHVSCIIRLAAKCKGTLYHLEWRTLRKTSVCLPA